DETGLDPAKDRVAELAERGGEVHQHIQQFRIGLEDLTDLPTGKDGLALGRHGHHPSSARPSGVIFSTSHAGSQTSSSWISTTPGWRVSITQRTACSMDSWSGQPGVVRVISIWTWRSSTVTP